MSVLKRVRRLQTIFSAIIFMAVFLFCWNITKFNILEIQLSYWGINDKASVYWNSMMIILSLSLWYNVDFYVKTHARMIEKKIIRMMFGSVFLCLFATGAINMHYYIHNLTAVYYFFGLPLTIYLMAYWNRKAIQYKEWLWQISFSTCMILIPLVFIHMFKGMAISETLHSTIVMLWGFWLLNIK